MPRLIDADALSERLRDLDEWCKDERKLGIEQARCMVNEAPTIDTVRHARWEVKLPKPYSKFARRCTACQNVQAYGLLKWCPMCGAKMDAAKVGMENG